MYCMRALIRITFWPYPQRYRYSPKANNLPINRARYTRIKSPRYKKNPAIFSNYFFRPFEVIPVFI